jgi:hypothetical protein
LLTTPAANAMRYSARNVVKPGVAPVGSNTYSTAAVMHRSTHATAICASASGAPGNLSCQRRIVSGSCRSTFSTTYASTRPVSSVPPA